MSESRGLFRSIFCLLFLCLGMVTQANASTVREEIMVNLRLFDGLSGETVYRVMTGHNGLIWIATNNGINVYNGKRLTTFDLKDKEHSTVTVKDLCETKNHDIYAATDAGLFMMPLGGDKFRRVLEEVEKPECLLAVGDTLYIGGRQGIQIYYDGKLKQQNVGVSGKGLDNIVRQYVKGKDGRIYFLSRFDLNSYDPKTGKIHSLGLEKVMPSRCAPQQFCISDSCFFIGTKQEGLYIFNPHSPSVTKIQEVGNVVTSVGMSADGYVTVSTDGSGAFLIHPANGNVVERYDTDSKETCQLPTNAVYSFLRDKNGVNWFGFGTDKKEREEVLEALAKARGTTIFYEAPHRLKETLKLLSKSAGGRPAACVREISKRFEEVRLGTIEELGIYFDRVEPRGEFVILIEGVPEEERQKEKVARFEDLSIEEHMALYQDLPEKDAMKAVAKDRGISKRDVYAALKK